jgi:predicted Zn-dependent protease
MSRKRIGAGVAVALAAVALAQPGAIGQAQRQIRTVNSMTPSEKAEGAKAHPQLLEEFGGLYDGRQAAYVASVGKRIATQSSLSAQQSDFTVSLLNSNVNNAFAIPGGYVYVTRQLMALMNDEAELAGVLGHEVGHVAAQHGKRRQSAAQRNSILGVLGQVLVGAVAGDSGFGQLLQRGIGTGAQLLTLKFSRSQEYEADDLGIRYLAKAGYDPKALSSMLASLAAQNSLDQRLGGGNQGVPEWASTHPDPASRVQRAMQGARQSGSTSSQRNAAVFMSQVDGIVYGEDPKGGVVEGGRFIHPVFRLQFSVPSGFGLENGAQAVSIAGSGGQAQFTAGKFNGELGAYVRSVFQQLAGQNQNIPQMEISRTTINGLPAAYGTTRATASQGGALDITIFAYQFSPTTAYHFIVATPAGQGIGPFGPMLNSMRRISEQEASAVRTRRVKVVTVGNGDTSASLAARMAFDDYKAERFQVLNGLPANARLTLGQKVKIVTY